MLDAASDRRDDAIAYRCPHCGEPLVDDAAGVACGNGHRFDRAREGYVNLLPAGRLKGRASGDSAEMVRSRRAVFDAGCYAPIQDAVADAAADAAPRTLLDVGCGEGAYLDAACSRSGAAGWGIDIAKPAVQLAARRHRHLRWAVASSHALPFADDVFDALINVFAPRVGAEMARVLIPGAPAVVVTPGADHLHELKGLIYAEPRRHRDQADDLDSADALALDRREHVRYSLSLPDHDLRSALLTMTPYWWRTDAEQRRRVHEAVTAVTVDVIVASYVCVGATG